MQFPRILILLLTSLLAACASAAPQLEADPSGLPGLDGLDALRRPSVIESHRISLVQPHSQVLAEPLDLGRIFKPTQTELAWSIFQTADPGGTVESLIAMGSGNLYIAAADFQKDRWVGFSRMEGGLAVSELSTFPGLVSPAGFMYFAALVPSLQAGGQQSELDSLTLVYDEDHQGGIFFVSPESNGGNDNNPGSLSLPWATLQKAADTVQAGDTVIVRPGNYEGFMLSRSGSPGAPVTFSALEGANVIFDNPETPDGINIENFEAPDIHDIVIEGFTVIGCSRAGIRVVGSDTQPAHDIVLRHNTCTGNFRWGIFSGFVDRLNVSYNSCSYSVDEHGIYLSNSGDENIARGNICFSNRASGIQFNADASQGGDGIMSDALIERNICFDNGSDGGAALNMDGLQDSVIRNNLLYDNHATGLVMYSGDGLASTGNLVICNTIIQATDGRWCVTINNGSTGNTLRNNIFWSRHSFRGAVDVSPDSQSGFTSDYNLVIGRFTENGGDDILDLTEWRLATGNEMHSVLMTDEACFLGPLIDDYHILTGSVATELDTDSLLVPPLDFDGMPRILPQLDGKLDAGCYEAE